MRKVEIGWIDAVAFILLFATIYFGFTKRQSLIRGENSTGAITAKWKKVIEDYSEGDDAS